MKDLRWYREQLTERAKHFEEESKDLDAEAKDAFENGDRERSKFLTGCSEYANAAAKSMRAMLAGKTAMEALTDRLLGKTGPGRLA